MSNELVVVTLTFKILSGPYLINCKVVCPSTFLFPDSYSKTVCPIDFKLDRDIDHHHS